MVLLPTARRGFVAAAALFAVLAPAWSSARSSDAPPSPASSPASVSSGLLGPAYPLEASVSRSAGLFHWVDSLAGTTAGKTAEVYQAQFIRRFGPLSDVQRDSLFRFRSVRLRHASSPGPDGGDRGNSAMLALFLEAQDLDSALEALRGQMIPGDLESLRSAMEVFSPVYEELWKGGESPRGFLDRVRQDPRRTSIGDLLARIVKMFGVESISGPPRLVVVPVPAGGGTHAEAVGRLLLLEIRAEEGLSEEAGPVVHENAHFLWNQIPRNLRSRLFQVASDHPAGSAGWESLREALPTALGQGVAGRMALGKAWSTSAPWYHLPDVDAYAKAIYPTVQAALDAGVGLDENLMIRLLNLYPKKDPRPKGPAVNRR